MNQEVRRIGVFAFYYDWPEEIQGVIQSYLDEYLFVVPPWCQHVKVIWAADQTECFASMQTEFQYRRGTLRISPSFLECDEKRRKKIILHEIIHLHTIPVSEIALNALDRVLTVEKDGPLLATLKESISFQSEGCTEDLAYCLTEKQP